MEVFAGSLDESALVGMLQTDNNKRKPAEGGVGVAPDGVHRLPSLSLPLSCCGGERVVHRIPGDFANRSARDNEEKEVEEEEGRGGIGADFYTDISDFYETKIRVEQNMFTRVGHFETGSRQLYKICTRVYEGFFDDEGREVVISMVLGAAYARASQLSRFSLCLYSCSCIAPLSAPNFDEQRQTSSLILSALSTLARTLRNRCAVHLLVSETSVGLPGIHSFGMDSRVLNRHPLSFVVSKSLQVVGGCSYDIRIIYSKLCVSNAIDISRHATLACKSWTRGYTCDFFSKLLSYEFRTVKLRIRPRSMDSTVINI